MTFVIGELLHVSPTSSLSVVLGKYTEVQIMTRSKTKKGRPAMLSGAGLTVALLCTTDGDRPYAFSLSRARINNIMADTHGAPEPRRSYLNVE